MKEQVIKLLRWSEQYTKTDMVYLTRGGFWLGFGHGFQILFGLLLLVSFANLLSQETYGTYQFILSVASVVSLLTLTGMGTAIMRSSAQGNDGALRQGFKTQLFWNIGIVFGAGTIALYYYINGNMNLAGSFLIVGALQPFISSFSLYKDFLIGKQAFKTQSVIETSRRIIPLAALLSAVLLTDNILIIVFAYFGSHTISLGLAFVTTTIRFSKKAPRDETLTNYSKHLSFMGAISKVSEHIDKILIWHFMGAAPVAIYTIAQIPISHMRSVFQLTYGLVFPKLAQKSIASLTESLPDKIRRYFIFVAAAVILYIIAAPFIFSLLLPQYTEAVIYSQLLALSVLAVPRAFISQTFVAHEMKKEMYILNISTPLVRIILLVFLLPPFGIFGAIAALLLSELYVTLLQWYRFNRLRKLLRK